MASCPVAAIMQLERRARDRQRLRDRLTQTLNDRSLFGTIVVRVTGAGARLARCLGV
jgi:hypothetical protein